LIPFLHQVAFQSGQHIYVSLRCDASCPLIKKGFYSPQSII
jgi:hypothetical protein